METVQTNAVKLLEALREVSQIDTYLSTFVGGLYKYTKWHDKMLHVNLNMFTTATGRFSSSKPNMQNMPRGNTFPVKRCFVSRWEGGQILEADEAQLEFRVAAYLSQDPVAMKEVAEGFDVHSYTAKVITEAGESTDRQSAKSDTFAPLYGATGHGRTPARKAYYEGFYKKYKGMAEWHKKLGDEALKFKEITLPSNRKYAFPNVVRYRNGNPSGFTRIKNYPVQGFATADIVPLLMVRIHRLLKNMNLQSCIVNTVHDSIVIDVHPDETEEVLEIIRIVNRDQIKLINEAWGIDFNVPLLLESKIGPNWLETKDVA